MGAAEIVAEQSVTISVSVYTVYVARYEERPPQVDAVQWINNNVTEMRSILLPGGLVTSITVDAQGAMLIKSGMIPDMLVPVGNYVIRSGDNLTQLTATEFGLKYRGVSP